MQPPDDACTVLVVDLDGTLIRSDMLYESFWSATSTDWRVPFRASMALLRGKAALKRYLAEAAQIDVATLPYDAGVIAKIEDWRQTGGRTALVTASDQQLADAVAAHLALFDEVHGSDGRQNLKSTAKGAFLTQTFGEKGFAYMGDARADLPVWAQASRAITVNVPPVLRREVARIAPDSTHLDTADTGPVDYLRALRPHQWLKNVLVFLPMLAAHQLDGATFLLACLAFAACSMVASSVYILNDLLDLPADRAHPRKRHRPLAAGRVPIAHAMAMAAGLLLGGVLLGLLAGANFLGVLAIYYALTTTYSLWLKRQIVIDICVLAGLYTLRIFAGGAATGLPPSFWLLALSVFLFLSLAAVKRQAELVDAAKRGVHQAAGRGYRHEDLPAVMTVAIGAGYMAVLVLALYVNSPAVIQLYPHPEALWGACTVLLYWITRTVMLAHRGQMHDDPVIYAARDRVSQLCGLAVLACAIAGAYS